MKLIIHGWPDEQAVAILRNVHAAAGGDATVLLIEMVLPDHDRDFPGNWADLEMLLLGSSRERSRIPQPAGTSRIADDASGANRLALQCRRGETRVRPLTRRWLWLSLPGGQAAAVFGTQVDAPDGQAPMKMCPCPGRLAESSCFTSCRRQAPTERHANPTLEGGSDDEAAWHRPVRARAPPMRRPERGPDDDRSHHSHRPTARPTPWPLQIQPRLTRPRLRDYLSQNCRNSLGGNHISSPYPSGPTPRKMVGGSHIRRPRPTGARISTRCFRPTECGPGSPGRSRRAA